MATINIKDIQRRYSIVGNSTGLVNAIERAAQVAPIDLSVLIRGESGTGKEFFPKIIHEYSPRKHKNYIAINCGSIPEGTIDSELFGHVKGSFTGADHDHKGYFEEADNGTIFLDEIAEMPLATQARLLRVLESGEFLRVGSSKVQKTNVRIVAATNKDLVEAVKEGRFREDLYYRISTVQIDIPPLRERGKDISLLAMKLANDFSVQYGTPPVQFSNDAFATLQNYNWPGNVRQLRNVVSQIALFESGNGVVDANAVAKYIPVKSEDGRKLPVKIGPTEYNYSLEREAIFKILSHLEKEVKELKAAVASGHTSNHAEQHFVNRITELERDPQIFEEAGSENVPAQYLEAEAVNFEPAHSNRHDNAHGNNVQVHDVTATEIDDYTRSAPLTLEEIEKRTIIEALEHNNGKRKVTAEKLGISERTLYRKIKEYGLEGKNSRN